MAKSRVNGNGAKAAEPREFASKQPTEVRIMMTPMGTSGLKEFQGFVREAYNNALTWPSAYVTFNKLRRSMPEIVLIRQAFTAWARNLKIIVDQPDEPTDDDKAYSDFVEEVVDDMQGGVTAFMDTLVNHVPFMGWGWWEVIPGMRDPNWKPPDDDSWRSQYDDGGIGLRKLAWRDTGTFYGWDFDDKKNLKGLKQQDYPNPVVSIPLDKSLHITYGDPNNPEGLSPLEAVWRLERLRYGFEVVMGIGYEHAAGYLDIRKTEGGSLSTNDKADIANAARKILTAQEGNYALWPPSFQGEIKDIGFQAGNGLLAVIQHYSTMVLSVYTMQWIALNTLTGTGSFASMQDSSQLGVFTFNGMMDGFAAQFDEQIGKRLYAWNKDRFPKMTTRPKLRFSHISKEVAMAEIGQFLQQVNGILPLGKEDYVAIRNQVEFLPKNSPEPADAATPQPPTPDGQQPQDGKGGGGQYQPNDSGGNVAEAGEDYDALELVRKALRDESRDGHSFSYPAPHRGRPGERGGSLPRGAAGPDKAAEDEPTQEEFTPVKRVAGTFSHVDSKEILWARSAKQHEGGAFVSLRVKLKDDGEGILKSDKSDETWNGFTDGFARREVAAWNVDQVLGLDIVPECALVRGEGGEVYSLAVWVDDAKVGVGAMQDPQWVLENTDPQEWGKLALLDGVLGNPDRHQKNWMVGNDGYVWAIDNGLGLILGEEDNTAKLVERAMGLRPGGFFTRGAHQLANKAGLFQWDESVPGGQFGVPHYRFPLDPYYKEVLDWSIETGELEQALWAIVPRGGRAEHKLQVSYAMKRAQYLSSHWDEYFREPRDDELIQEESMPMRGLRRLAGWFGLSYPAPHVGAPGGKGSRKRNAAEIDDNPPWEREVSRHGEHSEELWNSLSRKLKRTAYMGGLREFGVLDAEAFQAAYTKAGGGSVGTTIGFHYIDHATNENKVFILWRPHKPLARHVQTTTHEIAHAIDKRAGLSDSEEWMTASGWTRVRHHFEWGRGGGFGEAPPTRYAHKSPAEDFAESAMLYFGTAEERAMFKSTHPRRYEFIFDAVELGGIYEQ